MHIYKITNLVNNKIYIGQTIQKNPKMRWYSHQADARGGKNTHLCNSMRKYGIDQFLWEVIDFAHCLDDLNNKEQWWLDEYRKTNEIYNLREAGDNKMHSDQSKEKMKASQRQAHARRRAEGRDTWTRRDGGAMKGKAHPRKGTKGLWHYSEEQKQAQSDRMSILNGTRGKTWSLIDGKRIYTEKKQ
jgi:group I intron endonuclease